MMAVGVNIVGHDALSAPAGAAGMALTGLEKTAGIVGGALGGLEKAAISAGAAITALGAAITATVTVGVMEAGKLQQAVANISSIKPSINTDGVFSALNLMQTRVAQSSQQMGAALYDVFSSIEVSTRQGLVLVEKFARGAIASITDAKTFGTAIMGELNAFKLGVAETDHLMDMFFTTVKLGVVTGAELAQNLGQVTQAAKQAGIGLSEMNALIVGVTKEGGSAADNMEHLTRLLEELHTKAADKGFKEIGISATEMGGKLKDPIQLLTELRAKLVTYTESAAQAALQEIFPNIRARQAALVIMNELDNVNAALAENETAIGTASDAYEKMSATFSTQTTLLKQSFDSILTSIGSGVLPVLTAVTSGVQDFLGKTAPLWDEWQNRLKTAFRTGGFDAWLKEVGNVAGELGKQIEKWIPPFTGWVERAKTQLGTTLKEVYEGTIVPWVTQRATDLKKQFEEEWVPGLVGWWNSKETQKKINDAMDDMGGKVRAWAGEGGDGNKLFKEAGESLGSAVVAGLSAFLTNSDQWLTDLTRNVRTAIGDKFGSAIIEMFKIAGGTSQTGSTAPFAPASGSSSGGASTPEGTPSPPPSGSTSAPSSFTLSSPNLIPYQFGLDQELTKAQADAACGPAAAVGFAHIFGREPTLREALELARDKGLWDPVSGMHGPDSEVALLGYMGIQAHAEHGEVDWNKIQAAIASGRPAMISTGQHYFEAQGYNPETGQYDFGNSGRVYGPQNQWMTPAQMAAHGGVGTASIFMDSAPSREVAAANAEKATDYHALARAYAVQYGVDPDIFEAMIQHEHGFQTDLNMNDSGDRGIAQINKGTAPGLAASLGITENKLWSDPKYQLEGAAFTIQQNLGTFGGDYGLALQAYNAGVYGTQHGKGDPGYSGAILAAAKAAQAARQTAGAPPVDNNPNDEADTTTAPPADRIGGGTEDPRRLTQEKLDAAFGGAEAEAAAGAKGRAILKAFDDALEGEKPHALETLAGTMADLKMALLNDPQLSPEEALTRYGDIMSSLNIALLDGGEEAIATARTKITELEKTLSLDKIQEAADKKQKEIERRADQAEKDALAQTARAVTALTTSKEAAVADRDAEQAESDRIAKAVEGAKLYVKAQEDQLAASIDLQKQERSFQQERAALDLKYMEDIALLLGKKHATDMSGVMAATAHTDPQAAFNQELRDKAAAHNVDVFNLNQQQMIKTANHNQDVAWKLEETALASTLKATILDPTAETARKAKSDWKDAYDYTVLIPRQAAAKWEETERAIGKIKSDQSNALNQLAIDTDLAKTRILALTDPTGLPLVKSMADTALDVMLDKSQAIKNNLNASTGTASSSAPAPSTQPAYQPPAPSGSGILPYIPQHPQDPPILPPINPDDGDPTAGGPGSYFTAMSYTMPSYSLPSSSYASAGGSKGGMQVKLHPDDILAIAQAMSQVQIPLDGQDLNRNNRTRDRYHSQSNLSSGVGALVSAK